MRRRTGMLLAGVMTCMGCRGVVSQKQQGTTRRVGAVTQEAKAGTVGQGGHTWHMKKAEVQQMIGYDAMPQYGIQAVPQKQITAMTMLVPVDWQFQGGPMMGNNPHDCNYTVGSIGFNVLNADKTAGMISRPVPASLWSNDRNLLQSLQAEDHSQLAQIQTCKLEQPRALAQRIGDLARDLSKTLEATGPMEPLPGEQAKIDALVKQTNERLAAQGSKITAEAGRLPLKSTDASDTGEGYLTVLQVVREDRLPNGATVWTTTTPMQVATFAPAGKYKEYDAMYQAMLDSVWLNPEYAQACLQVGANIQTIKQVTKQRLTQIYNQMAVDNMNAARQQAAIRQDAQQYANHVISNVAANRSAALEHSSQQFSLYMGDQAQYHDPTTGGIVQLPSGSTHAWASQTGNTSEYILTDSSSFNPNGQVGSANWTPMREVR